MKVRFTIACILSTLYIQAQTIHKPSSADEFAATMNILKDNDVVQIDVNIELNEPATLHYKNGLKIVSYNHAKLTIEDPESAVVILDSCENITIEGLNMYHSTEFSCSSSVIDVLNSKEINIHNNDISGCGMIGVYLNEACYNISISNNAIHDCTDYGVYSEAEPFSISINANVFFNNGDDIYGAANISGNEYKGIDYLDKIDAIDTLDLREKEVKCRDISLTAYYKNDNLLKIAVYNEQFGFTATVYFEENQMFYYESYLPLQLQEYTNTLYLERGNPLLQRKTMEDSKVVFHEEDIDQEEVNSISEQIDLWEHLLQQGKAPEVSYKEVVVSHETQLIEAIQNANSPTKIILANDIEIMKAPLSIEGKKDIILTSESDYIKLYTKDPESYIVSISNSENIIIRSLILFHETEFLCAGGVIDIHNCQNTSIINNDISGCGSYGISAYGGNKIDVKHNYIHDCTYWGLDMHTPNITVAYNEFMQNGSWDEHYHFGEQAKDFLLIENYFPITDDYANEIYRLRENGILNEMIKEQSGEDGALEETFSKFRVHYFNENELVYIDYSYADGCVNEEANLFVKDNQLVYCEYSEENDCEGDAPYYSELDEPWGNEVQAWFNYGALVQLKVYNHIMGDLMIVTDSEIIQSYENQLLMLFDEAK